MGPCPRAVQSRVVGPGLQHPSYPHQSVEHRGPGLRPDEARSFLRVVDSGVADVDEAGYVTLPALRPKTPVGRYAVLSRSGDAVSVNLEYLIHVGATAELVLDHG